MGPDGITQGWVRSCPQPALGMAWPGRGGISECPCTDPRCRTLEGLQGVAWLSHPRAMSPRVALPAQLQGERPMPPACPLHAVVSCRGCATRGQHCLCLSPSVTSSTFCSPIVAPGEPSLRLGWGSHFPVAFAKNLRHSLSWWQFPGGTGSPVSGWMSVSLGAHQSVCLGGPEQGPMLSGSVGCLCTPLCHTCLSQPPLTEMSPCPCLSWAGTRET